MTRTAALDQFFDTLYAIRPVDATFIGMHTHDHRLPDWSRAGHERATGAWRAAVDAIRATGPATPAAGAWEDIDLALAAAHADISLLELSGRHFTRGNPSLVAGETAFAIIGLITRDFLPAEQRASWLLQRLRQVPAFLAGASSTLAEAPLPPSWQARAVRESEATERLLLEGIPLWCSAMGLTPEHSNAVTEAAHLAAGAMSGFRLTISALNSTTDEAPSAGAEMLAACIALGHWVDTAPDELSREADERFAEESSRLGTMIRQAGAASMAEINERLAARRPTPGEYLGAFARVWDECRQVAEEQRLVTWPDFPIRYVPIPAWTRMAAPSLYYLYYRSPAPLDTVLPHEYVVTPIDGLDSAAQNRLLSSWNDSVIKLNHVVHHGALGHHVQNWHAARSPSRIGRIAATDCASRIAMLQGGTMAEGWACYATDLMDEAGFLTTDERVAEQHTRVRILARARVDLGFHGGRLTFDEAMRVYVDEVGMTVDAARSEVVKNSMFPGTAVMYWLGTQGVHTLRHAVSQREGNAFSLQRFHDAFLAHGSLPVALISRLMLESE